MTVPFGFSAGDIAMAIKVVARVAQGLKDSGGSAAEYQETISYLNFLLSLLQHLERLQSRIIDDSVAKAIQALALNAQKPILCFLADAQDYDTTLGRNRVSTSLKGGLHKTKWALQVTQKVAKLKANISADLEAIHLLLGSQSLIEGKDTLDQIDDLRRLFSRQQDEQQALSAALLGLRDDVKNLLHRDGPVAQSACRSEAHAIESSSSEEHPTASTPSPAMTCASQEARLFEYLAQCFRRLIRDMIHYLQILLISMPYLATEFHKMFASIPRRPYVMDQDCIHFEDGLGRKKLLPFAYFNNWPTFEGFLFQSFEDMVGKRYVVAGQYQLLHASLERIIKDPRHNWSKVVLPGMDVAMSMIAKSVRGAMPTVCPRCRSKIVMEKEVSRCENIRCCWTWTRYMDMQKSASADYNVRLSRVRTSTSSEKQYSPSIPTPEDDTIVKEQQAERDRSRSSPSSSTGGQRHSLGGEPLITARGDKDTSNLRLALDSLEQQSFKRIAVIEDTKQRQTRTTSPLRSFFRPCLKTANGTISLGKGSERYPSLLLPPDVLPEICIKVDSGRSTGKGFNCQHPPPTTSFSVMIHSRFDDAFLWRIEATQKELVLLHQQISNLQTAFYRPAETPGRGFGEQEWHSYLNTLLISRLLENAAITLCIFLSTRIRVLRKIRMRVRNRKPATSRSGDTHSFA